MAGTRTIDLRTAPVDDDLAVWDDDPRLVHDARDVHPARPRRRWRRLVLTAVVCGLLGWSLGSGGASAQVTAARELAAQARQGQQLAVQSAAAAVQGQKNAESQLAAARQSGQQAMDAQAGAEADLAAARQQLSALQVRAGQARATSTGAGATTAAGAAGAAAGAAGATRGRSSAPAAAAVRAGAGTGAAPGAAPGTASGTASAAALTSGIPDASGAAGSGAAVHYRNCGAVRAAGASPLHAGDPGYDRHLDRDGDGVACE